MTFKSSFMTSRAPAAPGVGSEDWIKEAYLAPDPPSLYKLMRAFPPTGNCLLLTTAASQDVMVHYVATDNSLKSERWKSAVAEGTDYKVELQDGTEANLRLFESLSVTQGDATDKNNGLNQRFRRATPFLE